MVRGKQGNSLLTLYNHEITRILEALYLDPEKADNLAELLPENRIRELAEESDNREEFAEKLMIELKESPLSTSTETRLYEDILAFLSKFTHRGKLHKLLSNSDQNSIRSEFRIVLDNLDGFLKYTNPTTVIQYLEGFIRYMDIVEVLKSEKIKLETIDQTSDELIRKLILKTIPQLGELSVYDLMFAIYERSSENIRAEAQEFIDSITPSFRRFYAQIDEDRKAPRGKIVVCPIDACLTDMLRDMTFEGISPNPKYTIVDMSWDHLPFDSSVPRLLIESVRNRDHIETPILLRQYQIELCRVALQGKNTIVTAPTGSGKTVIAANILKSHFEEMERNGQKGKALFMCPNAVILKQQADSLSNYVNHKYDVQIIQGSDGVPVRNAVLSKDLIVATPQIIVNLCNEHLVNLNEEIPTEQFYLSTFTIIFFDECHSALKNSPYANIMKQYHMLKNLQNMPSDQKLPQIVGLTASLGVGGAKDDLGAMHHIADLCSTFDVKELSIVRENIEELKEFSPIVPDKCCHVSKNLNSSNQRFTQTLIEMMECIERRMIENIENDGQRLTEALRLPTELDSPHSRAPELSRKVFQKPFDDKEHEAYLGWVSNQLVVAAESSFRDNSVKKAVHEALQVLNDCYLAICYNNNFHSKVSLNYLREQMNSTKHVMTNEMIRTWERYENQLSPLVCDRSFMIEKVTEYILDQNSENPDFRAIVFVKTRYDASTLSKILRELPSLKNEGIITDFISGLNKTTNDVTASKRTQQEKIKKFASGDIKVLVATSVAEEGLDIAKCNLVIKYNYATNEIAHVQRRGRGRAANSTCVLITNCLRLQMQESNNRGKETLMNSALLKIQKNFPFFKRMVDDKSSLIWQNIQKQEADRANTIQRQLDSNITYTIHCRKCDVDLCKSSDIKCRTTQYFVCDPQFWRKVRSIPFSADEMERDKKFGSTGFIRCSSSTCGVPLGRLIDVESTSLPCLSADSILIVSPDGNRKTVKKWKDILNNYFTPKSIRNLDIAVMKRASNFQVHNGDEVMDVSRA